MTPSSTICAVLRLAQGREAEPPAAIFDSRVERWGGCLPLDIRKLVLHQRPDVRIVIV